LGSSECSFEFLASTDPTSKTPVENAQEVPSVAA